MNNQFSSKLKNHIVAFLLEKHALGYSYATEERVLKQFDRFCKENYPDTETITPDLGLAWSVRKKDEKNSTFEGRISPVRELARYMNRNGIDAFVIPQGLGCGGSRFTPHIFTDKELIDFFILIDKMNVNPAAPIQHIIYPVLFRLLYSTGLRPIEAVSLPCKNIDLKSGVLYIEQSKGNRDRYIVLSDEMLEIMRKYWHRASEIVPMNIYFFPDSNGESIRITTVSKVFRKYWLKAKKLNNNVSDTAYYVHLCPEMFPDTNQIGENNFEDLLPEVSYE